LNGWGAPRLFKADKMKTPMSYTELQVTTNFSFLRGASHPSEIIEEAAALGYKKIAITDRNSLAGIVRAHVAAKKMGMQIIPACRLDLTDGPSLLAYPTDKEAYGQLSALLTKGNLRAEKGECYLQKEDVFAFAKGLKFIVIPPNSLNSNFDFDTSFKQNLNEYKHVLGEQLYMAATKFYQGDDAKRLARLSLLAKDVNVPLVATNNVHYHIAARRQLQDVLTCIREKCTIHTAGFKLHPNAERHIKPIEEMQRLFRHYPDALYRTQEIAEACNFSLDSLKYVYPKEITSEGRTPLEELEYLTWQGARELFENNVPDSIRKNILHELSFIREMDYAPYFLTVYDIVRFARSRNILCQGRGSAANSTICYCLGITSVNPAKFDLLFERFISSARNEPPDIDVDFEHERREEVIQYIYEKYGRDRAAIVATVTTQHQKGAIRDVGKAMGLSVDIINRLSTVSYDFTDNLMEDNVLQTIGMNANDPHLVKTLQLTGQFMGFPRQLGQHTGGFVITEGKMADLCPVLNARMENRTCIEWDKDDIEALGFLKIDVLALGMLTCIRKAFSLVKNHYGLNLTLANIPQDVKEVYDMISRADTIGVFQIESRAQQSMLPRLKPKTFYDLVIEVAIVRPGPIQGDMVHPYLRRRNGEEEVSYPSDALKNILNKTLGVPLFQEQAMRIAIEAAGFTPAEADELRRSMATFKAKGKVSKLQQKLVSGMMANDYDENYAIRVFKQLEGFGSYGFPESHAASFALLVYVSSWLKCFYPDVFASALLNSLPMGFYQPAQIVIDAQNHGVEVLPVDVNYSFWDNTLEQKKEKYFCIRLGFRQVLGLRQYEMELLTHDRKQRYMYLHSLREVGISQSSIEKLADADAFRSMGLDRRQALWEASALHDRPIGLFKGSNNFNENELQIALPGMTMAEHVVHDYATTTLSLKAHPVSFVRQKLKMLQILSTEEIKKCANGTYVKVAGLVLVRQRPGTAKGICFITIEDETGVANLVAFKNVFAQFRKEILQAKLLMVEGTLQVEGQVIHVIIKQCYDMSKMLKSLTESVNLAGQSLSNDIAKPSLFADHSKSLEENPEQVFYKGRNFK
jgi:error-prone DNA polymerase